MTDKEFLEEIKAREELEGRGYIKEICSTCNGEGWISRQDASGYLVACKCFNCYGKGYHWEGPITK